MSIVFLASSPATSSFPPPQPLPCCPSPSAVPFTSCLCPLCRPCTHGSLLLLPSTSLRSFFRGDLWPWALPFRSGPTVSVALPSSSSFDQPVSTRPLIFLAHRTWRRREGVSSSETRQHWACLVPCMKAGPGHWVHALTFDWLDGSLG